MKSFPKVNAATTALGFLVFGLIGLSSSSVKAQDQAYPDLETSESVSTDTTPLMQGLIEAGELEGDQKFKSQLKKFEASNLWMKQLVLGKLLKEISQEELDELELNFYRFLNVYANEGEPGTDFNYYVGFKDKNGNLKLKPLVYNSKAIVVPHSHLRIHPVLVVQNSPYLFSEIAPTGITRTTVAPMTVFQRKITDQKGQSTIVFPVYGGAITMNYDAFRLLRKSDRLKENTLKWLLAFTKLDLVFRPITPVHNADQLKLLEDLF